MAARSLVITELGTEPAPVESCDSFGSLAREERKRAGLGGGAGTPLSFSAAPLLPGDSLSAFILVQGPRAEQRVRRWPQALPSEPFGLPGGRWPGALQ